MSAILERIERARQAHASARGEYPGTLVVDGITYGGLGSVWVERGGG